jgi:hypothetical protein
MLIIYQIEQSNIPQNTSVYMKWCFHITIKYVWNFPTSRCQGVMKLMDIYWCYFTEWTRQGKNCCVNISSDKVTIFHSLMVYPITIIAVIARNGVIYDMWSHYNMRRIKVWNSLGYCYKYWVSMILVDVNCNMATNSTSSPQPLQKGTNRWKESGFKWAWIVLSDFKCLIGPNVWWN